MFVTLHALSSSKGRTNRAGRNGRSERGVFSSVVQIFHLHVSHSIRARRLQTLKISSTASTENYRVSFSVHRSVVIYHNKWVTKGKQIIINYKCEQSSFSLDTQLTPSAPSATTLHSSVRSRFVSRRFGTRSVCVQYKWMAHKFVYSLAKGIIWLSHSIGQSSKEVFHICSI